MTGHLRTRSTLLATSSVRNTFSGSYAACFAAFENREISADVQEISRCELGELLVMAEIPTWTSDPESYHRLPIGASGGRRLRQLSAVERI